jgi:hypothetical protein
MKLWLKLLKSGKYKPTKTNSLVKNKEYSPGGVLCKFLLGNPNIDSIGGPNWNCCYSGIPDSVAKFLGFKDRLDMYNTPLKKESQFGIFFENDVNAPNWKKCISAIEELING